MEEVVVPPHKWGPYFDWNGIPKVDLLSTPEGIEGIERLFQRFWPKTPATIVAMHFQRDEDGVTECGFFVVAIETNAQSHSHSEGADSP